MKKAILKAVVLGTLALSLLIAGFATTSAIDTGVAVCHDGPHNGMPAQ